MCLKSKILRLEITSTHFTYVNSNVNLTYKLVRVYINLNEIKFIIYMTFFLAIYIYIHDIYKLII